MAQFALPFRHGWSALILPDIMTYLLTKVSGVLMYEEKYAGCPEFEQYAKNTQAFFPNCFKILTLFWS
jgi:steroid 5-alpha reductase family enzyme